MILPVIILKIVSFHVYLAAQAALRDKTWKETLFKIMAERINVSKYI